MLYLGWIASAFLGGILLTLWLVHRSKKPTLRQRFSVIDHYQGMRYDDILIPFVLTVGRQQSGESCPFDQNEEGCQAEIPYQRHR